MFRCTRYQVPGTGDHFELHLIIVYLAPGTDKPRRKNVTIALHDGVHHPPPRGPTFQGRYLHSWSSGDAKNGRGWKHFAESFSEDVSVGIGTLLVVEQSSLENRPRWV